MKLKSLFAAVLLAAFASLTMAQAAAPMDSAQPGQTHAAAHKKSMHKKHKAHVKHKKHKKHKKAQAH